MYKTKRRCAGRPKRRYRTKTKRSKTTKTKATRTKATKTVGGKFSCHREKSDEGDEGDEGDDKNCNKYKCVNFEKGMYNSVSFKECQGATSSPWSKHWDPEASAFYYFNEKTLHATWVPPEDDFSWNL